MQVLKLRILLVLFINTFLVSCFAGGTRTIDVVNNCPFTVLWAAKGTPIKDSGKVVYCKKQDADGKNGDAFGTACFNNKGYCGQQLYHFEPDLKDSSKNIKVPNDVMCFFKYPNVVSKSDNNSDYILESKATRKYTVELIDRKDPDGTVVTQYSLNFVSQSQCTKDSQNYNCKSAPCGERLYSNTLDSSGNMIGALPTLGGSIPSGTCSPDKGVTSAFTQAEITMNDKQNDFYDISIINGVNVPISITPKGIFGNQSIQSELFCKTTGGKPTGMTGYMKGCTWKFTPPTGYKAHIFTEVSANTPKKECMLDTDCAAGSVCGLEYPVGYLQYAGSGVCGTFLSYQTMANISPLVAPPGIPSELNNLFKLRETFDLFLKDGTGKKSFTNNQLFMCETVNDGGHKYLDSCYNFCHGDLSCNENTPGTNTNASTACCGCIDWPGIPTDKNDNCTGSNAAKEKWLSTVKPLLGWLIEGCPDAYEYQYGDKHGTMQCSSKDNPSDTAINNINYTITFCPNGKGVFSSSTTSTSMVSGAGLVVSSEEVALPVVTNPAIFNDVIAAGVRCPKGQKRPALIQCNNSNAPDLRCLNAYAVSSNKIILGQWVINKSIPVPCFSQNVLSTSTLNNFVLTFGGGITFTFRPNSGWTCSQSQSQGNKLICTK